MIWPIHEMAKVVPSGESTVSPIGSTATRSCKVKCALSYACRVVATPVDRNRVPRTTTRMLRFNVYMEYSFKDQGLDCELCGQVST